MLTIRLQRGGKRNTPQYKVVLAQKTAANQKKFVEILGFYNPHTKELGIRSNDRLNYWMNEQHVELSSTVHNLFVSKELIKADKTKAFTIPKKEVVAEEAKPEAAPAEASAEASAETPTEAAPAETPTEAPAETTTEASAETPAEEMVVAVEEASPEPTPTESTESVPAETEEAEKTTNA